MSHPDLTKFDDRWCLHESARPGPDFKKRSIRQASSLHGPFWEPKLPLPPPLRSPLYEVFRGLHEVDLCVIPGPQLGGCVEFCGSYIPFDCLHHDSNTCLDKQSICRWLAIAAQSFPRDCVAPAPSFRQAAPTAALRSWLLTGVPPPFCLCTSFSRKICPRRRPVIGGWGSTPTELDTTILSKRRVTLAPRSKGKPPDPQLPSAAARTGQRWRRLQHIYIYIYIYTHIYIYREREIDR